MIELFIEFKEVILQSFDILVRLFGIAFATLGLVYIAGRMLNILKTDKAKNILAVFSIYILQFLYEIFQLKINKNIEDYTIFISTAVDKGWNIFLFGSISIVIYVSFCWRLYSRLDSFLDKKIGKDYFKPINKKNKKRKF